MEKLCYLAGVLPTLKVPGAQRARGEQRHRGEACFPLDQLDVDFPEHCFRTSLGN